MDKWEDAFSKFGFVMAMAGTERMVSEAPWL